MAAIGFVGSRHTGTQLEKQLRAAGARTIISDLRALKSTIYAAGSLRSALTRFRSRFWLRLAPGLFLFLRPRWIKAHVHHIGINVRYRLRHRE
jgi:hypothetical protein